MQLFYDAACLSVIKSTNQQKVLPKIRRITISESLRDIEVIFEDNHLLVVNKPANLLSQGDHTGDEDIQSLFKKWLKEKYQKPGNVFLGLVQRLDRPTRGLMVLARTSKSASRLSEQIRNRTFKKEYLAVVVSRNVKTGLITHQLVKDKAQKKAIISDTDQSGDESGTGSKKAVMEVTHLDTRGALSLIKINLRTGRFHQIRAQLAALGMPIAGDSKYGSSKAQIRNLALISYQLEFIHPTKREKMSFRAQVPAEYPWDQFSVY